MSRASDFLGGSGAADVFSWSDCSPVPYRNAYYNRSGGSGTYNLISGKGLPEAGLQDHAVSEGFRVPTLEEQDWVQLDGTQASLRDFAETAAWTKTYTGDWSISGANLKPMGAPFFTADAATMYILFQDNTLSNNSVEIVKVTVATGVLVTHKTVSLVANTVASGDSQLTRILDLDEANEDLSIGWQRDVGGWYGGTVDFVAGTITTNSLPRVGHDALYPVIQSEDGAFIVMFKDIRSNDLDSVLVRVMAEEDIYDLTFRPGAGIASATAWGIFIEHDYITYAPRSSSSAGNRKQTGISITRSAFDAKVRQLVAKVHGVTI